MRDSDKTHFLDSLISQGSLFSDAVKNFGLQFSAVQKQTEAIKHILPWWPTAASTLPPAAFPPPAGHLCPPPPPLQYSPSSSLHPGRREERDAGSRHCLSQPPLHPLSIQRSMVPETGDLEMVEVALQESVTTPVLSPGGRPCGESFLFPSVDAADPSFSCTQSLKERAVSSISGSQEGLDGSKRHWALPLLSPSFTSSQEFRVRGHNAFSHDFCHSLRGTLESGESYTALYTPLRNAVPSGSDLLAPLHCPTAGTSVVPLVLLAWLLALSNPSLWLIPKVRPGYAIQFTQCPPRFKGIRFISVVGKNANVLCAENCSPTGKGRIKARHSSRHEVGFYSPYDQSLTCMS